MNTEATPPERVIGLDAHPDSFTAVIVTGRTPATASLQKSFHKVPLSRLAGWAQRHTTPQDLIVLEASGNSFEVVRTLAAVQRRAKVLESTQLGRLKEAHANNDQISAVRIAKAFLAGTCREVWVPDRQTQERRDWFHAHRKATGRSVRARNSLRSYLSDNGVRLPKRVRLTRAPVAQEQIRASKEWSPRQWQVIEGMLLQVRHAEEQRQHWQSLIAQEVLSDEQLLALVRLTGVRDTVAFALGAIIGDIRRFASPAKLVSYLGLHPAFDHSGQGEWSGGIGGRGRKDLRGLLMQSAQRVLRTDTRLGKWGRGLRARKGHVNIAVAAVARKLAVMIWYLMMGRWRPLENLDASLELKLGKIIDRIGKQGLAQSQKSRRVWRQESVARLKAGKSYVLDPERKFEPAVTRNLGER